MGMYMVRDINGKIVSVTPETPEKHESILELRAMLLETEIQPEALLPLAEAVLDLAGILHPAAYRDKAAAHALLDNLMQQLLTPTHLIANGITPRDEDLFRFGYRYISVGTLTLYYHLNEEFIILHRVLSGRKADELLLR